MAERYEPPDHLTLQAAEAEEAKATRQQRLREESDFKFIMGSKQGRRFMWRLLGITRLFQNPFAGEVGATAFRCGEQNIGQQLLAEIHGLCPERYVEMLKEHQQDDDRNRARS